MKNLLVAQSGGPTAAINATLAGIIKANQLNPLYDHVYGGINGIEGVLQERFVDLTKMSDLIRGRTYEAFFPLLATAGIYYLLILIVTSLLRWVFFLLDNKNRKKGRILKDIATPGKDDGGSARNPS
jgi:hypothetical protein